MGKEHPLGRGFFLALALVIAMLGAGVISAAPLFEAALGQPVQNDTQETYALAVTMMVIPGAFLASIPARLRRKGRTKSTWKTCLTAFLGAILAAVGADLAGGSVLSGALQGNISGLAALAVAWAVGFAAVRLGRRWME